MTKPEVFEGLRTHPVIPASMEAKTLGPKVVEGQMSPPLPCFDTLSTGSCLPVAVRAKSERLLSLQSQQRIGVAVGQLGHLARSE
jgi:hypothetical protein